MASGARSRSLGRLDRRRAVELQSAPDPQRWQLAAELATADTYLHSYACGARLCSAHARRRREAATVLREAYGVADTAGIRLVAEAVVSAGRSLGVDVAELPRHR